MDASTRRLLDRLGVPDFTYHDISTENAVAEARGHWPLVDAVYRCLTGEPVESRRATVPPIAAAPSPVGSAEPVRAPRAAAPPRAVTLPSADAPRPSLSPLSEVSPPPAFAPRSTIAPPAASATHDSYARVAPERTGTWPVIHAFAGQAAATPTEAPPTRRAPRA
jgi:hypothetical protein